MRLAQEMKLIQLNPREISDIEMLAKGAFSPLDGFMCRDDYESVVTNMRLADGRVWPIPITLSTNEKITGDVDLGGIAVLHVEDVYKYDKEKEAESVYRTKDHNHPGVAYLYKQGEYLAGGKIELVKQPEHAEFKEFWFTPEETKRVFKEKGWRRVVGFQTRNPIHRAHEFIIKCAMEIVDGLFLNPLVGETKKGDIPADVRMACYKKLIDRYFPKDRVFMGVYGAAMRYAGPREAVMHALVRKNFGCTHFIVGRDHAGVGNYYGTFDAQYIFDEFKPEELGITPLFFDHSFYCRHCGEMATVKTCPHPAAEHFNLSGTKVRELLGSGEIPPPEFTRPEVANILIDWFRENR